MQACLQNVSNSTWNAQLFVRRLLNYYTWVATTPMRLPSFALTFALPVQKNAKNMIMNIALNAQQNAVSAQSTV
jgi:hypothetical protein